jgi:phosphoglycolate phosphatase-like HAD superfamily hydrolase
MKLTHYKTIFWDFDGVIKDSVEIKTAGYLKLFEKFGTLVVDKIREHHLKNGGVSRFIKIPFYMKNFVGQEINENETKELCAQYSKITINQVVHSPWVPGALEYLKENHTRQDYFVVSGTPQEDMDIIVDELAIRHLFKGIYGSPEKKNFIVKRLIMEFGFEPRQCLFIGDALADYDAAMENQTDFLLRKTADNEKLFNGKNLPSLANFLFSI